ISRKNALALHLLLQGPESLIDIVIANEYPQTFSNRAAAALVGGRDVASDQSRSTDLEVVRRLLAAIADNLIFDCLTLVERIKAGTLDSGDMDEHVSAAVLGLNESIALGRVEPFDSASSHRRLLECTSGPYDHRATVHPKSALSWESIQGCATSNARFEP